MLSDDDFQRLRDQVANLDRRVQVIEEGERTEPWHQADWPNHSDFLSQMRGSPGIVVDAGVARATPCHCYTTGEHDLCFSKGIVGALDQDQLSLYCTETIEEQPTPAQKQRLQAFRDAADLCKMEIKPYPKGKQLEPWLGCMSRELRSRGIEA